VLLLLAAATIPATSQSAVTVDTAVRLALRARDAGDDDLTELYLRKARQAVSGTRKARFQQAMLLLSVGQPQKAVGILNNLAPSDQPGYLPAHEWKSKQFVVELAENLQQQEPTEEMLARRSELVQQIERQYELIVQAEPKHEHANEQLAQIRLHQGNVAAAIEHLARVVDRNEDLRLLYAELLLKQGETRKSRTEAERAIRYHARRLAAGDLDDDREVEHRVQLAAGLGLLKNFPQAAETLLSGGQDLPEDPRLRDALGKVLLAWSESIEPTDEAKLLQRMELLDRAFQLRPADARILARIASLAGIDGEAGEQARLTLKDILASGTAPGIVHFVLGINAYQKNDREAAIRHLELANRINPNTPATLNNLAVLISRQQQPDLQQALELIQRAIELDAENPEFYDSRGQVYLKLERYTDAIADLESALRQLPGRADIHERLAIAYAAVGDKEAAELHRRRAEAIGTSGKKMRVKK
jgi:tetratricopeptide (TPR) repeat protein